MIWVFRIVLHCKSDTITSTWRINTLTNDFW